MSDPSSSRSLDPRSKQRRTSLSNVRPRSPSSAEGTAHDGKGPAKRARKAINCEPCRNSKLKVRRPCSSCILRGTVSHCYQGQDAFIYNPSYDNSISPRAVDPTYQFSQIRQALSLLESHLVYVQRSAAAAASVPALPTLHHHPSGPSTSPDTVTAKYESSDLDHDFLVQPAPGAHGRSDNGGFYAGPTSAVSHLSADQDLLRELPHASIVDGLVDFYFEYTNWIYRHVNERAFVAAWNRYKAGAGADRIVLATVCMVMAVALHYLPSDHELLRSLPRDIEELGTRFYNVMRVALQRRQAESRAYTLELVELLLIRGHYLTLSKIDSEEIWSVKGELVTIGTAMGLHRDPGKRKMSLELAERRRWAFWHIILLERWQAFMFGRPLAIASHHFDVRLPSYVDPELDPSGRLYDANIALFRLAYILGDIMDDAISLLPVPYESVLAKDRKLQEWWDTLPPELDMDDYRLRAHLASATTAERRTGVQSMVVRTAFLHIRFTMHRPYASRARELPQYAYSRDTAVSAAEKLIALSSSARPEILSNTALAVPGHMSWGPLHCFSAAMFLSFQLINDPGQPTARVIRQNVLRAISTLEHCLGMPVADKALAILRALGPLYAEEFLADAPEQREAKKAVVLPRVRRLQFPYHDSPSVPLGAPESPHAGPGGGTRSPGRSSRQSGSPTATATMHTGTPDSQPALSLPPPSHPPPHAHDPPMQSLQHHSQASQHQINVITKNLPSLTWDQTRPPQPTTHSPVDLHTPPAYNPPPTTWATPPAPYSPVAYTPATTAGMYVFGNESGLWGANTGFVQGEWAQIMGQGDMGMGLNGGVGIGMVDVGGGVMEVGQRGVV
ncbi:hypothetical protein OF83DRAFT_1165379 [Amylostereum chailletii]|nr:hypothetical protein OF83DRAFT_1165379 [Amylostereum chailletii]